MRLRRPWTRNQRVRRLLNEHANALVAVGTVDGTVKLYKGAFEENASLLTAWSCGLPRPNGAANAL